MFNGSMMKPNNGAFLKHIMSRSGGYDRIEKLILKDPYADGHIAASNGLTLDQALKVNAPYSRRTKEFKDETTKLVRMGWRDYHNEKG